ncbi:MAG TPA: hypothetical protein VGQ76_22655 [Thermoanaerobaculia bacterium]|jgi:hypothetical protein|nr:hypothetical protein [Thermoanaerobaculia bacterium]
MDPCRRRGRNQSCRDRSGIRASIAPGGNPLGLFAPVYFVFWTLFFVGFAVGGNNFVEHLAKSGSPQGWAVLAIMAYITAITMSMAGIDVLGWYVGFGPDEDPADEARLKELLWMGHMVKHTGRAA